MKLFALAGGASLCGFLATASADAGAFLAGAQSVNFWLLDRAERNALEPSTLRIQEPFGSAAVPDALAAFPSRWFRQPLDHFSSSYNQTWLQRYWVNDRHYKPGGPVIVLDGGETSGENRLPFLDTGICDILARATHGLSLVLEHRYYGRSLPVTNFSTDALRFLDNAQSAADSAAFMANVMFDGIEGDLTAPGTPWIYYGGSYAGARAAHMKVLYPGLVFGAIASSAVTHASLVNWEYHEMIRLHAPQDCSATLVSSVAMIDRILDWPLLRRPLKRLFGLADLEHSDDFMSVVASPLGSFQGQNWDPAVGSTRFTEFCDALKGKKRKTTTLGLFTVASHVLNYAAYIREKVVSRCPEGYTVEDCFGSYDDLKYTDISIFSEWRLWLFQVCTEWGYFSAAPPDPDHPRIISKRITLEYSSRICKQAYPPGAFFKVPHMPNVTVVNALGDFALARDRLAFIDGAADPWRPATPHSWYAPARLDSVLRPFKDIPHGVHHWDENGLARSTDEPKAIRAIHAEEIAFVRAWLKEWNATEARASVGRVRAELPGIMRVV